MKILIRIAFYIAAFIIGIGLDLLVVGLYVKLTYSCSPSAFDPCDAGGMTGFSYFLLTSPFLGLVAVYLAHRIWNKYVAASTASA